MRSVINIIKNLYLFFASLFTLFQFQCQEFCQRFLDWLLPMEPFEHRKLFVGGVPRETDEDTLREYFSKYGTVEEALVIRYKATGVGRGFGFVIFTHSSMAEAALRHNNHVILGRKVDVKRANPKDEEQEWSNGNCSNDNDNIEFSSKKIFVGGLAPDITEEEFKSYFDSFGTVTDAVVIYDKESRRRRGFGFITYDSQDVVDNVLKNKYHELKNKMVEVKRATPKENGKKTNYNELHTNDKYMNYYDCYGTGLGYGGWFPSNYDENYTSFPHYYYYYPAAFQTTVYYHTPYVFAPSNGGWGSPIVVPRNNHAVHNNYVFYPPPFRSCMNGSTSEDVESNCNGSCQQMEDSTTNGKNNGDYDSAVVEVPTTIKSPVIDEFSSLKISAVEYQMGEMADLLSSKSSVEEHQRAEIHVSTAQEAVSLSTKTAQNGYY